MFVAPGGVFVYLQGSTVAGALGIVLALSAVALGAGGNGDQQDADEPSGTFKVDVVRATFPGKQYLGLHSQLRLVVANVGNEMLPNLTVSISNSSNKPGTANGFDQRMSDPNLSDPVQPIWVLDRPPLNSETAYTNTGRSVPSRPTSRGCWSGT